MATYASAHQRPRTHGSSTMAQDRFIPGVWNIFDPYNPYLQQQQQQQQQQMTPKQQQQFLREQQQIQQQQHNLGEWTPTGVPVPAPPQPQPQQQMIGHVNWAQHHQDALQKWCDRNAPMERPRTYDRYYEKTPSNFHSTPSLQHSLSMSRSHPRLGMHQQTEQVLKGQPPSQDSAVSLGSSDDATTGVNEDSAVVGPSQRKVKRSKRRRGELQYSRTMTERDVRHLERQLSMKKTIRKKIMRDLQQAFVGDPSRLEQLEPQRKQQPTSASTHSLASALRFGEGARKRALSAGEQRFLDLLRDSATSGSEDSGHGGSPAAGHRHKFRSVRERPTHERTHVTATYDSSTDDNDTTQQQQPYQHTVNFEGMTLHQQKLLQFHHMRPQQQQTQQQQHYQQQQQQQQREDEIIVEVERLAVDEVDGKKKSSKKGFWQFLKKSKK